MQIVSIGDNLHEMSNPVYWGKYFKMLSAENFIQSATITIGLDFYAPSIRRMVERA